VPPGLTRGRLVDVYAVADPAAGTTAVADGRVTLVVRQAPVQAISGRSEGVLSTPTTAIQVVVAVSADDVADVLAAISGRPLAVVVHDSVDSDAVDSDAVDSDAVDSDAGAGTVGSRNGDAGAAPTSTPATGGTTSAPAGPAG
jgi:hypothetical protein